jgi:hypothetical protein
VRKLMIVAAALIGAATVASAVPRSLKQCPPYMCGTNGTQFDGMQIEDALAGGVPTVVTLPSAAVANARPRPGDPHGNGTQLNGIQFEDARAGAVLAAVTLPSGEVLALDTNTISTPQP